MFNSDDKDRQAEFFSDLPDTAKETKKRRFLKGRVAVSLSQENLIFFAIGFIMLLIVCYSWGVERGKNLVQLIPLYPDTLTGTSGHKRAQESEDIQEVKQEQAQKRPTKKSPKPQVKKIKVKLAQAKNVAKTLPYIQIASFRTDKYARREIDQLKNRGYQPFLAQWGEYRVVCVGGYKNKDEAAMALKQLKKVYADCILRAH